MIRWKKIVFNKSNKITQINNKKDFFDFSNEVELGGYKPMIITLVKTNFSIIILNWIDTKHGVNT